MADYWDQFTPVVEEDDSYWDQFQPVEESPEPQEEIQPVGDWGGLISQEQAADFYANPEKHQYSPPTLAGQQKRVRRQREAELQGQPRYDAIMGWQEGPFGDPLMRKMREEASQSTSSLPSIMREPINAAAQAGATLIGTAARPFSKDVADYIAQTGEVLSTKAEAERKNDWFPTFSRMYGSAAQSVLQAAAMAPAGPFGMAAGFAATEANDALFEAEKAGLKGQERLKYASVQGAIEGTIMSVFNKLGLSGMEGLVPKIGARTMKSFGKEFLKATAEEIPEELLTEVSHALAEAEWKIDPNALDPDKLVPRLAETAGTAMMSVGAAAGLGQLTRLKNDPAARQEHLSKLTPEQAEVLQKESPSRGDFEKAGITEPTSARERKELAKKFRETSPAEPTVPQQSPIEPVVEPSGGESPAGIVEPSEVIPPAAQKSPIGDKPPEQPVNDLSTIVDTPPLSELGQKLEAAQNQPDFTEQARSLKRKGFNMEGAFKQLPEGSIDREDWAAVWNGIGKQEQAELEKEGKQQVALRNENLDNFLSAAGIPKAERGTFKLELLRKAEKSDVSRVKRFDELVQFSNDHPEYGMPKTEHELFELLTGEPFTEKYQGDTSFDFGANVEGSEEPVTTGTKNVKTDELRQKTGMGERPPVQRETFEQWEVEAERRIFDDPTYAPRLAAEIAEGQRSPDKIENAVLGQYIQDLENRRKNGEDVLEEIATAAIASEQGGAEAARALVSRTTERYSDYSLAGLVRQHFQSVKEQPSEESMAKKAEFADRIEQLEKELAEEIQKREKAELDAQIAKAKPKKPKGDGKPSPTKRRATAEKNVADAWAKFKEKASARLRGAHDITDIPAAALELLPDAIEVAKAYIKLGVVRVGEFISAAKQHMPDVDESLWRKAWSEGWGGGDKASIGAIARKLTKATVEAGITDREAVVDAVHEDLKAMGFEVSRSEAMAAISGYGDFRELSKDEVSKKVREIKGEIQQLLKLEDMQAGQPPKKTGIERREPSEAERQLIKQVNEAKKKGGYQVTDPDKQLKSALAAAKTAARNRITDLETAIASREKIVSGQTKLKPDAELESLRKQRDELNTEYQKIFPPTKKEITEAQRTAAAIKSAEREIEKLQKQLKTRNFDSTKTETVVSKELASKKAELAKLRAARKAAKEFELSQFEGEGGAGKKSVLSDAAKIKAVEKMLDRQIAALQGDLYAGRLGSKGKKAPLSSEAIEAKKKQIESLKDARDEARAASPEYQAQQAAKQNAQYKKTLERSLAHWERVRDEAAAGILPKKRKPTSSDDAILEKKYQIEQVKRHARAEIEEAERQKRGKLGKALGFGGDLLDLVQSVMTTGEMSFVLRQGAPYTLGHPIKASRALAGAVRSALSRRADFALHDDLRQRPDHPDMVRGGVDTTESDGPLSHREELIRSRIASWLAKQEGPLWVAPRWAAEGLLGFERAFRSFANTMRADLFSYMKASVQASRPGTWSADDAKVIGTAANDFSGRSKLPLSVGSGRIFFAPRWVWSRVRVGSVVPLMWKGDKATRLAIGKVYVRAMLGWAGYMLIRHAIYSMMADDDDDKPKYELDPRSSDFGKMKLGETRVDSGAGFNQLITLGARLKTGETKQASGKIVPIRGDNVKPGTDDTREVLHRFLDSKLAPLPSAVMDWLAEKNVVGKKATTSSIIGERTSPMTWRDIWDAEKELNVPQGTVAAIDAFFGAGVSTYGPRTDFRNATPEKREEQIKKDLKTMQWDDPEKPAYAEFLTEAQLKEFSDRRRYKRGSVISEATEKPERKKHKDDESFAKSMKELNDNLARLEEMKAEGVTHAEAKKLFDEYWKKAGNKIGSDAYSVRLQRLVKLLPSE